MKNNKKAKLNTGKDLDLFFNASHWMPLPELPKEE